MWDNLFLYASVVFAVLVIAIVLYLQKKSKEQEQKDQVALEEYGEEQARLGNKEFKVGPCSTPDDCAECRACH